MNGTRSIPNLFAIRPPRPKGSASAQPTAPCRRRNRRGTTVGAADWLYGACLALTAVTTSLAGEVPFTLNGVTVVLEEVTDRVTVHYRSLRLNRATGTWNAEIILTNDSDQLLQIPLLLVVDSFSGTSGPLAVDGQDGATPPRAYYDLSWQADNGQLGAGDTTTPRTITLGVTSGIPSLVTRVFGHQAGSRLALTSLRTLDATGQPLPEVRITQSGPTGNDTYPSDSETALATLGTASGDYTWRFDHPDTLPTWRQATLIEGEIALLPSPWLAARSTQPVLLTPFEGGQLTSADQTISLSYGPGAVTRNGTAVLTPLTAQTLPAPLPLGWSPLQAFWIELTDEPRQPGTLLLKPWGIIGANETAFLIRWSENALTWEVQSRLPGRGTAPLSFPFAGSGAFVLAVGDPPPDAPPAPEDGYPLQAAAKPLLKSEGLTAVAQVDPPSNFANLDPRLVTATATVVVSNPAGVLPSGTVLRTAIADTYELTDGSRRRLTPYEQTIIAYQRPGDTDATTLHARFPLRPLLLFGPEDLTSAVVHVDVLASTSFTSTILDARGGAIGSGDLRLLAGAQTFGRAQTALLRLLPTADFTTLVGGEGMCVHAFELTTSGPLDGAALKLELRGLPPNERFVLARVLSRQGWYGLEPTERLVTDSLGRLNSLEPEAGDRLPGIAKAGQYVLIQVAAPQGLIIGIARNSAGEPVGRLPVRIPGSPWLTFSESPSGGFRLLAPVGSAPVEIVDPATGNSGQTTVTITDPASAVPVSLSPVVVGPRVIAVSPAPGATEISRVTPITLEFSKPLNPASLGAQGIQLIATNGLPVAGTVTLNLRSTIVTLLPHSPLTYNSLHTLLLSAAITDFTGEPLEGETTFTFTTAAATARNTVARLMSHEPDEHGMVLLVGDPGLAEPEAPVILVNETTGHTATVLSKVDGSFSNTLPAAIDDTLSAVIVNANGTRNAVPVSRQLFLDGRVGLFDGGGEIEVETAEGSVWIAIEPGAIAHKTVFKVEPVAVAEVMEQMNNTPPEEATLIRALRVETEGDELSQSADLSLAVGLEELGLQPGESPTNRAFVILEPLEVDGVPVYRVVDSARYENGRVSTHSPPFTGLLPTPATSFLVTCAMLPMVSHQTLVVGGAVVAAPASVAGSLTPQQIIEAISPGGTDPRIRRVPGAIVTAYPTALAGSILTARPGLVPGAFVAKANSAGHYAVWLRYDSFETEGVALIARSDRTPNLIGSRGIGVNAGTLGYGVNIVIPMPDTTGGALDRNGPLISADPPHASLPIGEDVEIPLLLRDDWSRPELESITFDPSHSIATETGLELPPTSVAVPSAGTPVDLSPTAVRVPVQFRVEEPGLASFRVKGRDEDGNSREVLIALRFGASSPDPAAVIAPHNPLDDVGPQVISTTPEQGVIIQMGDPFKVRFSEALSSSVTNGLGVDLHPPGASVRVSLSADQQGLTLVPYNLIPDTSYRLTLSPAVTDLVGNGLDQDPNAVGAQPFELDFRTAPMLPRSLPGVQRPAGTVVLGNYALTIDDNDGGLQGTLRVHRLNPDNPDLFSAGLPPFPRAMTLVPSYAFKRRPDAPGFASPVETKPLLVVVGGLIGPGTWPGQWVRVMDVSNPEAPYRLATAYLTPDPTAVTSSVKFSGSKIVVHLVTTEGPVLQFINLQALILGGNYTAEDWRNASGPYFPGFDANGDGDFVDQSEGDLLPKPREHSVWGLEWVLPLYPTTLLADFDVAAAGGLVVGAMPDRLQVITFQGLPVGLGDPSDTSGALPFSGTRINRVLLDLDFPYADATGSIRLPVALLAGGGYLYLVKLTDPMSPLLLNRIKLGDAVGSIRSLVRSGPDEYTVGTTSGLYVVRRSNLSLPEVPDEIHASVQHRVNLPVPHRSMGATSMFFVSSGGGTRWVLRPPRLSFLQVPTKPVVDVATLSADEAGVRGYLEAASESPFLLPALVAPFSPGCPSGISPPNAELHHYALVQALGDLGNEIRLSVESLDLHGVAIPPKGLLYPPVHLTDETTALRLDDTQPGVAAVVGHRLSADPTSELYNQYLAEPIVVIREPMSPTDILALTAVPGRQAVWSGHGLRLSLDPGSGYAPLTEYESRVAGGVFQAGISRTYATLPGEYIDTPNRSLPASPIVAGVNLQSGEFRTKVTDLILEGRHQDLMLTRNYESRSRYAGPFGRGWDFNWNVRLFEIPADFPLGLCLDYYGSQAIDRVAHAGDVLLIDGDGSVRYFARIDPADTAGREPYSEDPAILAFQWDGNIQSFYASPAGEFSVLFKFTDGAFAVVSPSGVQTHFLADGRLDRVIGVYAASRMECSYRPNGWLDKVTGDRGVSLLFGRYVDGSVLDTRSYDTPDGERITVGLISKVQVSAPSGYTESVLYSYDANGNLVKVEHRRGGVPGDRYLYSYDPNTPHQLDGLGREGLGWPSQKIHYTDGLVVWVEQDGARTEFGGAVKTAAERYALGGGTVTAAHGGQTAAFSIDRRARPTEFANQSFSADDAGRLTLVSDADATSEIRYDTANPVYRFRGNILSTRQISRPGFQTSLTYDQSAWNRVIQRVSTEGVDTSITYTGPGAWVSEITETTGPVTRRQRFDDHGQMTQEESSDADHTLLTTYEFDSSHLLSAVVRGGAVRTDVDRDAVDTAGSLSQGRGGYDIAYNTDGQPELLSPSGSTPSFEFGYARGLVQTEKLEGSSGQVVNAYTYDPDDKTRIKTVTEAETGLADLLTDYTYDSHGRLQRIQRADEETTYTYDGAQLTGVRGPGSTRRITFARSLPVEVVEQGVTNTLTYDTEARLAATEIQGLKTAFTYGRGQQVQEKTLSDTSGTLLSEMYSYDAAGRVQDIASASGNRSFTYFADGVIRTLSIDDTPVREVERDEAGRMTELKLPRQIEYLYQYDSDTDQPDQETIRYYPSSGAGITFVELEKTYDYDEAGRLRSMTLPVGTWFYDYDDFGYMTSRTDPDFLQVAQTYSPGGMLLQTTFEDGSVANYAYDAARRLERVGDLQFLLDADEKLISEIRYPDGTFTRYESRNQFFEPDKINHNGLLHNLTWAAGRLVEIRAGEVLSYAYDGLGRKTRVALDDRETLFDYDASGHLVAVTNRLGGPTSSRVWRAAFDTLSRLSSEAYPSGLSIDWNPGITGMPSAAIAAGVSAIEWQGPGLIAAVVYEGGLRAVHHYNSAMQKVAIRYVTGDLASPDQQAGFEYVLTPAGRVLSEERSHENRFDVYDRAPDAGMRVVGFHLSATNVLGEGATIEVTGFSFDGNGEIGSPTNRIGSDARAAMASTATLNYRVTQADGLPISYNPQGAVAQVPVWIRLPGNTELTREVAQLSYDDFGMLNRVERGLGADRVTITYVRDGLGRVVQRDVVGPPARCQAGSWQYAWRGQKLIEEYQKVGGRYALWRRYVYCGPYLLMVQAAEAPGAPLNDYVPLVNINGSICGYASPDGEVLETILYGPYGTPVTRKDAGGGEHQEMERSSVGFTLLFQGMHYDPETGLYQMGERNLHPQLGRFLQRDNLLYVESRALFTAFNGDPVGKVDPSGALTQTLQGMQETWKAAKKFGGKSDAFAKAWNATVSLEPREESDLGLAGIDLLTSGLKLSACAGGEDYQQLVKQVSDNAQILKTGVEALQIGLDMRRDKLLLTAIKAHALAPAHYSPRMKWLSAGGANAGYNLLDADFFADETYQRARSFRAGSGSAGAFYLDQKKASYNRRQGNLLSLAQKGHSLAGAYLAYAFKDDSAPGVQTSQHLMEASGAILELADEFRKVAADKDLSAMTFSVGRGARLATAHNLFKARSHLQLAAQLGFRLGQEGVLAASDEYTATAYRAAVKQFNDDGGFLTVFSGLLTCANVDTLDSVAHAIQRYQDFNLMNSLTESVTKPDPRTAFYLRGIDAP